MKENNTGFTLLEILLYLGIVSIVLLAVGAIGLNIFFGKAKLTAIGEVSQNARFTIERIGESIRSAEVINNPVQGTFDSTLSLQMANLLENPTVVDLLDNTIRIRKGTGAITDLTSNEVTVTSLQFSNVSYSNTPGTIRIQMTVEAANPENRQEYSFEKTFYTTANIYEKP